jgi:hypothetical protein
VEGRLQKHALQGVQAIQLRKLYVLRIAHVNRMASS